MLLIQTAISVWYAFTVAAIYVCPLLLPPGLLRPTDVPSSPPHRSSGLLTQPPAPPPVVHALRPRSQDSSSLPVSSPLAPLSSVKSLTALGCLFQPSPISGPPKSSPTSVSRPLPAELTESGITPEAATLFVSFLLHSLDFEPKLTKRNPSAQKRQPLGLCPRLDPLTRLNRLWIAHRHYPRASTHHLPGYRAERPR